MSGYQLTNKGRYTYYFRAQFATDRGGDDLRAFTALLILFRGPYASIVTEMSHSVVAGHFPFGA